MEEMSRCIHCTRCVRFGQEIAGVMELGMSNRGEHSEIETFVGRSVDSELSGNMIDICPVGALTSKPFRYSARTWELSRRKSISPHDSTGANLIVQVKDSKVMRVVPLENEAVNECWIADRDRFSYEALRSEERLTQPMLKQNNQWIQVDWKTALEYIVHGLKSISTQHGKKSVGLLASPHSTIEELYLASTLMRGLGSPNIDYRLRHAEFETAPPGARWLGMPIAALSNLQSVLVVGSNLRKDHPLFAQRIRQAARRGGQVATIASPALLPTADAWAMPLAAFVQTQPGQWAHELAAVACAVAQTLDKAPPVDVPVTPKAKAIATALLSGERKAILLGNAAAHHPRASSLLALANWIGEATGAIVGYLTEAANTVGAQVAGALPGPEGLNAEQMLGGALKAAFLLGCEPGFDTRTSGDFDKAEMVVTLSPFKCNLAISDALLPISPFTETSGTFINAEGRIQSFHAVVKALGDTRPGWKVLRVLADMLQISCGHPCESSQDVLAAVLGVSHDQVDPQRLSNRIAASINISADPVPDTSVGIYALDPLVRRAPSLQKTADARATKEGARA
jgi:NADH-quinone oxidoreductase subunit G